MNPKVIVFISAYLPGTKIGGPAVSIRNLVLNLKSYVDFSIVTLDRDLGDKYTYEGIFSNTWVIIHGTPIFYMSKVLFKFVYIIRVIHKAKPDVIYLNSFFDSTFTIPILLMRKLGLIQKHRVIIAPRGELFSEALNFSKIKKFFYLKLSSIFGIYNDVFFHATDDREKSFISERLNVDLDKIKMAMIMSDVVETAPRFPVIREKSVLKVVFLSRISKDKNLLFTFQVLEKILYEVQFDIYGPIEDSYIWEKCLKLIPKLPQNISVTYMGVVPRNEVKNCLYQYDLFFLPTFAENYGHAIAESLMVGTPVLISDNTPWKNLDVDGLGWDISLNKLDEFVTKINSLYALSLKDRETKRGKIIEVTKLRLMDPKILNDNISLFH